MMKKITKNIIVKICCIVAASGLWIYVSASQNTVGKLPGSIQIKALNVPSGLMAIYDVKTVDLKIMAEPAVWKQLNSDSFSAFVDLSSLSEGTYQLDVKVTSSVPNVQIVEKSPDKVFVSLEKIETKEVTINKKIEGDAGLGLVAGNILLTPDKVVAKGPKSIIDSLSEATAVVRLNGETEDFKKSFKLFAFDADGKEIDNIEFTPDQVDADITLVKAANSKTVGIKVITDGQLKSGFYISGIKTTPDSIDVVGTKQSLDAISYLETESVNIGGISDSFSRDVSIELENEIALQANSPTKVKVTITIGKYDASKEIYPRIEVKNLPTGYVVGSYDPNNVKAVISGSADILNALKPDTVVLQIDLGSKKLTQATESLMIDIRSSDFVLPDGISLATFSPSSIMVNLVKKY